MGLVLEGLSVQRGFGLKRGLGWSTEREALSRKQPGASLNVLKSYTAAILKPQPLNLNLYNCFILILHLQLACNQPPGKVTYKH